MILASGSTYLVSDRTREARVIAPLSTSDRIKPIFCNKNLTLSTLTASTSSWSVIPSGSTALFGYAFKDTALSSDTGDWVAWLTAGTTLNMRIDGDWYASNFRGNLIGNCSGSSGSCTGNAATSSSCTGNAATASKWATARTLTLTGSVTGSVSIDGSGNVSLATTTNHNHDWRYPQNHITSFAFTGNNQPLSRYVTFDVNAPAGGPGGWVNGFMSVHNNYLASYIVLVHRSDDWYLGWNQYSTSNSTVDTAPVWRKILHSGNYNNYAPTKTGDGASGTWSINITGSAGSVAWANTNHPSTFPPSVHTHNWLELAPENKAASTGAAQSDDTGPFTVRWYSLTGCIALQPSLYGFLITCAAGKGSVELHALWLEQCDGHIYHRGTNGGNNTSPPAFKMLWQRGDAVTSAVWNDLGECRISNIKDPGYVINPYGEKTINRLEAGTRITSDTWGFLLGDDEDQKATPVAIAGRVLAYPYKDKLEYKIGDAVCSAPGGTIDIMTRKEIQEYPDRIIGIVNEIPDYDIWEPSTTGGGANQCIQTDVSGSTSANIYNATLQERRVA